MQFHAAHDVYIVAYLHKGWHSYLSSLDEVTCDEEVTFWQPLANTFKLCWKAFAHCMQSSGAMYINRRVASSLLGTTFMDRRYACCLAALLCWPLQTHVVQSLTSSGLQQAVVTSAHLYHIMLAAAYGYWSWTTIITGFECSKLVMSFSHNVEHACRNKFMPAASSSVLHYPARFKMPALKGSADQGL